MEEEGGGRRKEEGTIENKLMKRRKFLRRI